MIFLPTETGTGTGAHVNAPFYGTLDRRNIDFTEPYNALLLDYVLDLCLDAVAGLAEGAARRLAGTGRDRSAVVHRDSRRRGLVVHR